MAENSKIQWTDHTFNPWVGCEKVSAACDNCYAEGWAKRAGRPHLFDGIPPERTSIQNWYKVQVWNKGAELNGIRQRVFCASLADVFDERVPTEWREDLWELIRATPHLDWLILTKRPENFNDMLPEDWGNGWSNVWLGVTVEDNTTAARRIPILKQTRAARRFLSCEPLLCHIKPALCGIDLVIVGGESGSNARFMDVLWARDILCRCIFFGASFFMKQMGDAFDREQRNRGINLDLTWGYIPPELRVREFPGYTEVAEI